MERLLHLTAVLCCPHVQHLALSYMYGKLLLKLEAVHFILTGLDVSNIMLYVLKSATLCCAETSHRTLRWAICLASCF
jgi:hypothetical protein